MTPDEKAPLDLDEIKAIIDGIEYNAERAALGALVAEVRTLRVRVETAEANLAALPARLGHQLKEKAVLEFSERGGLDPRGAALWDAGAWLEGDNGSPDLES